MVGATCATRSSWSSLAIAGTLTMWRATARPNRCEPCERKAPRLLAVGVARVRTNPTSERVAEHLGRVVRSSCRSGDGHQDGPGLGLLPPPEIDVGYAVSDRGWVAGQGRGEALEDDRAVGDHGCEEGVLVAEEVADQRWIDAGRGGDRAH